MLVLAVDTTTSSGSAALLDNGRLLCETGFDSPVTHSRRLLPAVDFVLRTSGRAVEEIDGYAVARGPGSFTGIRIGLSTVKSLAFASKKPIAPVSTLEALALKLKHPQARLLCPLIDAKKGEIYAALFESSGRDMRDIIPQGAYGPDQFFSLLPSQRVIYFLGNGLEAYREKLLQYVRGNARFPGRSHFIGFEVGLLGMEILREGKGIDSRNLEPLYFRKSQAEGEH